MDERDAGRYCSVPQFLTVPVMIQGIPAWVAYILIAIGLSVSIFSVMLRQWIVLGTTLIAVAVTWSFLASKYARNPRWLEEVVFSRFTRRFYSEHRNLQS